MPKREVLYRIKPLDFNKTTERIDDGVTVYFSASCDDPFGYYSVTFDVTREGGLKTEWSYCYAEHHDEDRGFCETIDEAKKKLSAVRAARLINCLEEVH